MSYAWPQVSKDIIHDALKLLQKIDETIRGTVDAHAAAVAASAAKVAVAAAEGRRSVRLMPFTCERR